MDESSVLIPNQLIAQLNGIIRKKQANNSFLQHANRGIDAFINDDANDTEAIRNKKQKMSDYRLISDALGKSNDSIISDCQKLKALVEGERDFIGEVILRQLQNLDNDQGFVENQIEHYRRVQNNVPLLDRLNPLNWTYTRARQSRGRYERLLGNITESIRYLNSRVEKFNEIEWASRQLFTESRELITGAIQGVRHIEIAKAGFPSTFSSEGLGAWRTDILVKKEAVTSKLINRILIKDGNGNIVGYNWEILEGLNRETFGAVLSHLNAQGVDVVTMFMFPDGSLDINRVVNHLFEQGVRNGFLDIEWEVLSLVFGDQRINPNDLCDVLSTVVRLQEPISGASLAIDVFRYVDRMANEFLDRLLADVEQVIWSGINLDSFARSDESNDLDNLLRRTQLIMFFNSMGHSSFLTAPRLDLTNFNRGDDDASDGAFIVYRGDSFFMSDLLSLLGIGFSDDKLASVFSSEFMDNVAELNDWSDALMTEIRTQITSLPIINQAYRYINSARTAWDVINVQREALLRDEMVSQLERDYFKWQTTQMDGLLGNSVFIMQTPNGIIRPNTPTTPVAIINASAIYNYYGLGYRVEDLLESIMEHGRHPRRHDIRGFVRSQHTTGARNQFADSLNETFTNNFEAIQAQFPNIELCSDMPADRLPIDVLDRVIQLRLGE